LAKTSPEIQLLRYSYTLLIPIALLFNGGMRIVSVDCPIYEVHSPSAMRAPRETPHRSMKDTCPTPRIGTCVFASRCSGKQVS